MYRSRILGCLLLALASLAPASGSLAADSAAPPLYVAERGASRVYVFGVAVPRDRSWLTPTVARAIAESGELWQEEPATPCPFNRELNIALGTRASGQLFDDLTEAEEARVTAIAEHFQFPLAQFQIMRPWGVGAVIAALDYPRHMAEYAPDDTKGVVQAMFEARGLPVRAEVEDCDQNVRFYAGFSDKAAVQYIMYRIDLAELPADRFPLWSEQWLRGDLSGWEGFNRHLSTAYPDLYQVLEAERNEAWARRIDEMLTRGGTYFIHVGIQHTLGTHSIQEEARARGIAVRRM